MASALSFSRVRLSALSVYLKCLCLCLCLRLCLHLCLRMCSCRDTGSTLRSDARQSASSNALPSLLVSVTSRKSSTGGAPTMSASYSWLFSTVTVLQPFLAAWICLSYARWASQALAYR